jgi:hypothetical protein
MRPQRRKIESLYGLLVPPLDETTVSLKSSDPFDASPGSCTDAERIEFGA